MIAKDFNYDDIEKKINYSFNNKKLLLQAFTHSSFTNECKQKYPSYERLEFLGDAILEMITSIYLYNISPNEKEGVLTKTRAKMVCTTNLSNIMIKLDLSKHIILGKGEQSQDINNRSSILEDVVESLIGAIYLDGGFDCVEKFIHQNIINQKELSFRDYKSELQEYFQSKEAKTIEYRVIDENGPEHCKTFTCELVVDGHILSQGVGKSKKLANQDAAKKFLEKNNL